MSIEQPRFEFALQLARRLAALPEASMRAHALADYLERQESQLSVYVLAEIHRLGRQAGPPFDVALHALAIVLTEEILHYDRRSALYLAAKDAKLEALSQLFFNSTDDSMSISPTSQKKRPLTLGHRKSMARSFNRLVLEKLLRDPEPDVIVALLENPRIVEEDIVLLAARRPTMPELQKIIFSSTKWIQRYAVKKTLVLNPDTPTEIAIRLLGFLVASDLRLVASHGKVVDVVRAAAEKIYRERSGHHDDLNDCVISSGDQ